MRVVLQRVARARVAAEGKLLGRIDQGYVLLVGFAAADDEECLRWMADKILTLRVFADHEGKMNRDLTEVGGGVLIVSQFTLYGDARRGRRPSFIAAAPPDHARALYEQFVRQMRALHAGRVETGEFGATMQVELVNDGPVTLMLEK